MTDSLSDLSLDVLTAAHFARLALDCIGREYPNQVAHAMTADTDAGTPRSLTPTFYGCFDWHSAVHGHWLLARLMRFFPNAAWVGEARDAISRNITAANIHTETKYVGCPQRAGFERPYGLAWLLQLTAELHEWNDPQANEWRDTLRPLEVLAVDRLASWLPNLTHPIRSGEHSQSAFAMGLVIDHARTVGNEDFEGLLKRRTLDFHAHDRHGPLDYEPSGHDFVSPCLAEADLMRRVMSANGFADWLSEFLPTIPANGSRNWLSLVTHSAPSDGKIAHLDGLNLSRAWMLEGIASGLPEHDERVPALQNAAETHAAAGLASVTGEHYAGGHWLGSFAVYLTTRRGVS